MRCASGRKDWQVELTIAYADLNEKVVIPKMTAVSPLAEPNSSLIDSKNAPKLYATPNTTKVETNAAAIRLYERLGYVTTRRGQGGRQMSLRL